MRKKIIILINDSGGAEILTSLIKNEKKEFAYFVIADKKSPAFLVAKRKKICVIAREDSEKFYKKIINLKPDYFFYNTSWSKKEYQIAKIFKKKHIPTVAFLDHWMDYRERFGYPEKQWRKNLPDFTAVGDKWSYKLAKKYNLPRVLKINNYYFIDLVKNYQQNKTKKGTDLLFLSQSVLSLNKIPSFHFKDKIEFNVIKKLIENFPQIAKSNHFNKLVLRIHPSQKEENLLHYKKLNQKINLIIEKPADKLLTESLSEAKTVLGLDSMAMFVSFLLGKPTYSLMPRNVKIDLPINRNKININIDELKTGRLRKIKNKNKLYIEYNLKGFLNNIDKIWQN